MLLPNPHILKRIIAVAICCLFVLVGFSQSSVEEIRFGLEQLKSKEYEAAMLSFTKAIEKDSTNVEAYTHRGREYFFKNNYSAALQDFNTALKFNPKHYITRCYKGRLLAALGDYKKAFKQYQIAIELEPISSYAYRLRGVDKFEIKDYKGAAEDLYMAIEINPKQPAYTFLYSGISKIKIGNDKGALKDFRAYGLLTKKEVNIYEMMGDEYVEINKYDLALQAYDDAILLKFTDNLMMKRGVLKSNQGDKTGAFQDFTKVEVFNLMLNYLVF